MEFIKKYRGPIVTFITTIFLTLFIFYEVGILSGTILISDLNAEYQPLLMQVRRILTGQMGLYNFNTTLGDNFIGTFFYYMSSPLNILTLFFKNINTLVIVLVTLKLGLTSVFSYFYFKYQIKEEKRKYLLIISILYTLSSFSLSYYLHIMWLDIYMLFPLLLLGIDKMIKERKHLLYIISLMLIIFCNYYFAYMVCIFSFLYFNYKLLIDKEKDGKKLKENIHFLIVSFFTVVGTSIVLWPIASEIGTYSRQNSNLFGGEELRFGIEIKNIVKTFILGNVDNIDLLNDNNYYLYTSIIVFPLLYLYFINKKISLREKFFSILMLLILIFSISCNYLNYAWHGFVPPSFFNGRYTFMFILFILMLCLRGLHDYKGLEIFHYFIMTFILFIPILCLITFNNNTFSLTSDDYIKLFLFIMYIFILKYLPQNKYMTAILIAAIIYEINLNGFIYLNRYNFNSPTGDYTYEKAISYIKANDNNELFYRIEDNNTNTDNYSILYDYYSIDYFMSTVKKDLINFFINLDVGNHSYTKNTISYDGRYYLISSLLNVKYYIEMKSFYNDYYNYLYTVDNNYEIYENPYSLNVGYMVNNKILDTKLDSNGLENINKIYKDMSDIEVLEKVELEKIDDYNYKFINNKENNFYILVKLKNWYSYSDLTVSVNDESQDNTNSAFYYFMENVYDEDEDIYINLSANEGTISDIEGIYVYYIDNDKFEESINKLKEHQLVITSIKSDKFKGTINVDEAGVLFTSIPYDKDLNVYVDGKKVKTEKVLNTFLGVKLDKGKHEITIKYKPKTLYKSFIPSVMSLTMLWGYLKLIKRKKKES